MVFFILFDEIFDKNQFYKGLYQNTISSARKFSSVSYLFRISFSSLFVIFDFVVIYCTVRNCTGSDLSQFNTCLV